MSDKELDRASAAKHEEGGRARNGEYEVSLTCRTPLAHPKMTIKAESAEEAKAKFNEANGIRGSVHRYIVRADGTID